MATITRTKTTNWFPHDSNARNDEKLVRLLMKHGAAGYGVYFMILERLCEDTNYMSVKDYNMIAFNFRVDASLVKSVVEDFGLFVFTDDGKYFYSESFTRRMGIKDGVKTKRSAAGKKGNSVRWAKKAADDDDEERQSEEEPAPEPALFAQQTQAQQAEQPPEPAPPSGNGAVTGEEEAYRKRFFDPGNKAAIEQLMMSFSMKPPQLPNLRTIVQEITNEWKIAGRRHVNYTDWCSHLINTLRIKLSKDKLKPTDAHKPAEAEYLFAGGFGGKDV